MKGQAKDVEIDTNITYSLKHQSFNRPLKLVNRSDHTYVFKIKTNQRTVISLQITHDFLPPGATKEIMIKLADKPSTTSPLKLEFNYAVASEEDLKNKDSKMTSVPKENVFKTIITVENNQNPDLKLGSPRTEKIQIAPKEPLTSPTKDTQKIATSTPVKFSEEKPKKEQKSPERNIYDLKAETINITELVDMDKTTEFVVQKSTKIEIGQLPPQPKPLSAQSLFEKVESQQIQIPSRSQSESQKKNIGFTLESQFFSSSKEDSLDFKSAESPFQPTEKEQRQYEITLSELQRKIEKERTIINNLKTTTSCGSEYPLSLILAILIASFALGSLLGTTLA